MLYLLGIGDIFSTIDQGLNKFVEWLQFGWQWLIDFVLTYPYLAVPFIGFALLGIYSLASVNK